MVSKLQVYKLETVTCACLAGDGAGDRNGVFMTAAAAATKGRGKDERRREGGWGRGAVVPRGV